MTPEQLKKFSIAVRDYDCGDGTVTWPDLLCVVDEIIAAEVAAEREACAVICDGGVNGTAIPYANASWTCATLIRARAQK
jgi:hypothetical protein